MKKLLFLFALSLCSIAARAYDFSALAPSGQTLYYNITSNTAPRTVEVTIQNSYYPLYNTYPTGNLIIPSSVTLGGNTYSVTSIGANTFNSCRDLTSVTIPNSVTSIGEYAFAACYGLTSLTIPNSVTSIGHDAFEWSGLTSVTIPNSVTSIGEFAFSACSGLASVIIGNSLTSIEFGVFAGCERLTSVTIPNSVISIGREAFSACISLTSVTIPNSVTSIGNDAFRCCFGLTSITIPNSVTSIGEGAFNSCRSLASIIVESGNSTYDSRDNCNAIIETATNTLIQGCNNTIIPNFITHIGDHAFLECAGLTDVIIPNTVTSIGWGAFSSCANLTSINIPNLVTSIGDEAFMGCSSLTSIDIPNTITTIGINMFSGSGLTSITIPNSVTSIAGSAFYFCNGLTSVTIPNSVTTIEDGAFSACRNLTSVTIGNSVTSIGYWSYIFDGCPKLKTVYNLSNLNITNSDYGLNANRVVNCTEHSGSGDNIIYKIPTSYTFVDVEDNVETHIPRSTVPTNFIYYDNSAKDGGSWKAKNFVLTDGQDAFEAPETFTAETATYTREFTNSNRSTLYLPFTAAIPENFEVYDFTSFANNTISFTKREDSIYAYTPYLVGYDLSKDGNTTTCTITKTNAVFPKSESANYHPVTHDDMTFSGVISRTQMTSTNNYGYSNGFFVQSGGSAHVNPFRCYFTYTPSGNAPQSLPPTLNVEVGYGDPVGIDAVETPEQEYDGRYGKDVYDMLGRLVRKNAENLEGLPRGIYLWKGKKFMNYDL